MSNIEEPDPEPGSRPEAGGSGGTASTAGGSTGGSTAGGSTGGSTAGGSTGGSAAGGTGAAGGSTGGSAAGGGGAEGGTGAVVRTSLPDRFWWVPYVVGLAVLVLYGVLLSRMFERVEVSEIVWARKTYLFTGVESLAFAAAGFFFGREVNRGRAESAEARANVEANRATQAETKAATKNAQGQAITEGLKHLAEGSGVRARAAAVPGEANAPARVDPGELRRLASLGERWFFGA